MHLSCTLKRLTHAKKGHLSVSKGAGETHRHDINSEPRGRRMLLVMFWSLAEQFLP